MTTLRHPCGTPLDVEAMQEALEVANLPTLLMVLFQLTGDDRWLREPYRPTRPRGIDAHDDGGFPVEVQQEIRRAATRALQVWAAEEFVAVPRPEPGLLREMLSCCFGEDVPAEYVPLMREHLGLAQMGPGEQRPPVDPGHVSVVVIGAGISGLLAAIYLKRAGIAHVVLERGEHLGGVWRDNRYPGAGVDTPSYLYHYSFAPYDWSRHFARRDEVVSYLEDVASRYDVTSGIRFGTAVLQAEYHEGGQVWRVTTETADGHRETITTRAVICAVGLFGEPSVPEIDGRENFAGPIFHSAHWPDDLDLDGRRVAVIGSGASAMQIVPTIVERVAAVQIFQRTPQWIVPAPQHSERFAPGVHRLMNSVPYYRNWYRARLAWTFNDTIHPSLRIDPSWSHPERSVNSINDRHRKALTQFVMEELDGRPDLQDKALPRYPPYGKRILLDHEWFRALKRDNVQLVTEPVDRVARDAVVAADGQEYPADVVVLCTGFQTQRYVSSIEIVGRHGLRLREAWREDDPQAYLGMTTPGFPNLFFMFGPATSAGGGSVISVAESQVRYILQLLRWLADPDADIGAIEVRRVVNDDYNRRLDEANALMAWSHPGMGTYVRNARGRVVVNMPWRVLDYWAMTREPDPEDFVLGRGRRGHAVP